RLCKLLGPVYRDPESLEITGLEGLARRRDDLAVLRHELLHPIQQAPFGIAGIGVAGEHLAKLVRSARPAVQDRSHSRLAPSSRVTPQLRCPAHEHGGAVVAGSCCTGLLCLDPTR